MLCCGRQGVCYHSQSLVLQLTCLLWEWTGFQRASREKTSHGTTWSRSLCFRSAVARRRRVSASTIPSGPWVLHAKDTDPSSRQSAQFQGRGRWPHIKVQQLAQPRRMAGTQEMGRASLLFFFLTKNEKHENRPARPIHETHCAQTHHLSPAWRQSATASWL